VRIWDVRADIITAPLWGMRCDKGSDTGALYCDKRSDTGPCTVTRGQILGPCKLILGPCKL
jgi:hypothetical protein